jgi:glycosyltransferase involved in cell wall biosynthesis
LFEKLSVKFFDQLILAEDGYESYFTQRYKNFKKYTIIRNFPIVSLIKNTKPTDNNISQFPMIIYAGALARIRGIKEIIQAMGFVRDRAELWLLGKWESEKFEKECKSLKAWEYTKYLGLKPLQEVYSYMKTANIGIATVYPVKNNTTSLLTKLFEYMACSLPMVTSNFPYWQRIFGECALFANPYDPKAIAEKILYLLDNPDKAKKLGNNGRKLIEEKYSWEAEQRKLLDMYEKVLNK